MFNVSYYDLKKNLFQNLDSFLGDVAIQCNLETSANSHAPRATGGNQPAVFPALDTRGLHTLAELCLRRADYEFCAQNVDHRETNKSEMHAAELSKNDTFKEPFKVHESKSYKRRVSDNLASLRREQVKVEDKETAAEEKCDDLKERKKQAARRSINVVNENNSTRLHKLEEELEKMLQ